MKTQAHFMEPIQHAEKLTHFTGVSTDWPIEGILFNNAGCHYVVGDDGDYTMHSLNFDDGSECYFEVLADGKLSHFMSSAFVELRDGLLIVSPRSVYEDAQRRLDKMGLLPNSHSQKARRLRSADSRQTDIT
ncbi:hypothetical protein AB7714_19920 [Tardiphaga sp. 1201_B9_N1_1]|uniref:hypothetical protein n=1 Tax=unclassified Tardiphaga TaxID=2631404 RepID=UPI003F25C994